MRRFWGAHQTDKLSRDQFVCKIGSSGESGDTVGGFLDQTTGKANALGKKLMCVFPWELGGTGASERKNQENIKTVTVSVKLHCLLFTTWHCKFLLYKTIRFQNFKGPFCLSWELSFEKFCRNQTNPLSKYTAVVDYF